MPGRKFQRGKVPVEIKRIDPDLIGAMQQLNYTTEDVARIFEVTVGTVRKWVNSENEKKRLPAMSVGGKYVVTKEALVNFAIRRYLSP